MVSPTQLCWRYHSLPLNQWYDVLTSTTSFAAQYKKNVTYARTLWTSLANMFSQQYILMTRIPAKISFISLTRSSVWTAVLRLKINKICKIDLTKSNLCTSEKSCISKAPEKQIYEGRAASRFAPSQWEMVLLCNDVSHWLGANLESALSGGNCFYLI